MNSLSASVDERILNTTLHELLSNEVLEDKIHLSQAINAYTDHQRDESFSHKKLKYHQKIVNNSSDKHLSYWELSCYAGRLPLLANQR